MLDPVDLSLSLSKQAYKPLVKFQTGRLYELATEAYDARMPVVIVFEGWDAAGKGTTIRLLTGPLDPRGFKVLSTQAPRTHEQQKPWLWRFWMQIPRRGQMAIFDRSWYGRVLVERVEGLTPIPDWIRAYQEINQFERTLAADGTIFVKLWLHISREEQLRRFIVLTQDRETAWQVTAEDWEHHRKYDEYLAAVRDMLASTHTPYAPWEVVPATDPYYRTFHCFRTIIERLELALGKAPTQWPPLAELEGRTVRKLADRAARQQAKAAAKEPAAGEDRPKAKKKATQAAGDGQPEAKPKSKPKKAAQPDQEDGVHA